MTEHIARLLFAVATAAIGLGLGLPSLADWQASGSPESWTCAEVITAKAEGWVQISGCQLDLAAALYEEDRTGHQVVRAWVPSAVAPAPADGSPSPLLVRTTDPETLKKLTWGRDAVAEAGDDKQALQNVLGAFQQAGARHLVGRLTWNPSPAQWAEAEPLRTMLTPDAGILLTERPPWLPGWGWTLVGLLGVLLAMWSAWSWFRAS